MPGSVTEELMGAVADLFAELDDQARVTLRAYAAGTTGGTTVSGLQGRVPRRILRAPAVLARRTGRDQEGVAQVYLRPQDVSVGDLTNPELEWTVQRQEGEPELDLRAGPQNLGGVAWEAFGPEPGHPVLWRARVVEGGEHAGS
jgi:hypothetical protein